jgi:hypothetical protein
VDPSALLNHLASFESLISLSPDQLMAAISNYVDILTSVGKYIIFLLFIIHLTRKLVTGSINEFKRTLLPDIYTLALIMVIFGNSLVYTLLCKMMIGVFNIFGDNLFKPEIMQFKGSFRAFIDTLAEQSKQGVDFFNIKAAASSVLTLFLSLSISLLLITYYVFVSFGMFFLLVFLGVGPVIAGFYFFFKKPFFNWLYGIFACILFPVTSSVGIMIVNQAGLITGMQNHLIAGSLITCLLQIILAVCFMQLVIITHSAIFGVEFFNVPVKIITFVQAAFGLVHSTWLNIGLMVATKKRG